MVTPGTYLATNHESLSKTNESQFKKARSPKLKIFMLYSECNQTINLKSDAKALYYGLLKLKYSPSIYYFKAQERLNIKICVFK